MYHIYAMAETFDTKLAELEKEKSELDLIFLQSKKQEYEQRISELLANPIHEGEEETAITKFNEVREYHAETKVIDYKIQHSDEIEKEINKRIATYQERKERVKNLPLYRDTEEGIAEILGSDPLYQYAKETDNKELIQKIEERSLTIDEYTTFSEKMYKDLFASTPKKKNEEVEIQTAPKTKLPVGMIAKIDEILINNNKFTTEEIECFLKKELKKNGGEIMASHIKNKFKERANEAKELLKEVISDFPKFKIIDNTEEKSEATSAPISKHAKLIASLNPNIQQGKEKTKNQLQRKLNKLAEETTLERRIDGYIKILEKLGHQFSNKETFKTETIDSIETHASIQIEEGIIKALKKIIGGNLNLRKTEAYGYRSYELGDKYDNRRILFYPNKEIMKICSHPEYDSIIDSRPSSDKR